MSGWRKRQVMEMAKQAGMFYREFEEEFANANTDGVDKETLEAFAELVRADEREKILDMCKEGLWDGEGIRFHLNKEKT